MEIVSEFLKNIHMIRRSLTATRYHLTLSHHVTWLQLHAFSLAICCLSGLLSINVVHVPTLYILYIHLALISVHGYTRLHLVVNIAGHVPIEALLIMGILPSVLIRAII